MVGRYQGYIIHAVWKAARKGETLNLFETAQSIAAAIGSPHLLDAIVDALVQESTRQQACFEATRFRPPPDPRLRVSGLPGGWCAKSPAGRAWDQG